MTLHLTPDLIAAYLEGETLRDLAARLGTSPQTLRRRLIESGVTIRPLGRPGKPLPGKQRVSDQQILDLADGTRSCQEIGDALGIGDESVRKRLVRLGVPRLPGKARMEHNHFWAGGRSTDRGYILVKAPEHPHATAAGYVREHRLVMEQMLGRYLEPGEVVDHIDGRVTNNHPSNLRLFASNAEHLSVTLKGKVPNWSEDGRRRILEAVRRGRRVRRATPEASGTDARP